ncbi:uncharacterized protein LOC131224291 [Magnolia sinica]|uniref:uncharacterized protein LOC131224291 n=1 Tax=Magnolia sinica TaxID=86752 RepID=UPI00265A8039|nr:uncharacterized protein LOC131224291 [Magnolia sinica]
MNASITSALAPKDLRHELKMGRRRRTPEIEDTQEIVAKNKDPWETLFAELNNKILTLEKNQQPSSVPTAVQAMMEETKPLFISVIMSEVMPQRFRTPPIIQYSGSSDPSEHVEAYRSRIQIQTVKDAMMCKGFSITLTGSARSWYRQLKPNSVGSFVELSRSFLTQFISDKKSQKPNTHLFTIKQEPKESLKDYIARFNEEALQVEDYDDKMTLSAVFSGLKEGKFTFSIGKNPPKTLAELITRAQKYANAEEFSNARKNVQANPDHRDKCKYYCFHRDHGHNTANCVDLKDEIEALIRKSHLHRYTKEERTSQKEEREQPNKAPEDPAEMRTIFGGSSDGGDSNRAQKAHSRKSNPEHYIHMTERPSKELQVSPCSLTFTEDDAYGIHHPQDDALVVTMTIANHKVYRILVDTGSSADVIYSEAFKRIGIPRSHLRLVKTPLHGFTGER